MAQVFQDYQQLIDQIKQLRQDHGNGKARIYIHHEQNDVITNLKLGDNYKIKPSHELILDAQKLPTIDKIIIK